MVSKVGKTILKSMASCSASFAKTQVKLDEPMSTKKRILQAIAQSLTDDHDTVDTVRGNVDFLMLSKAWMRVLGVVSLASSTMSSVLRMSGPPKRRPSTR